jgi:hopanoid biosynthesis associated protein HpnK
MEASQQLDFSQRICCVGGCAIPGPQVAAASPQSPGARAGPLALIITGDDFGRHEAINRAVLRAHRDGVLTSASLMVAERSANDAVRIARENPTLAVGLHAVAVNGRSLLGHGALPHITDSYGRFPADEYGLGIRYFFSTRAREELERELEAQFRAFAETGLPLDHVDGHSLMHMHPSVLPMFLRLADRWGASGFRYVHDDLRLSLSYSRRRMALKVLWSAYYRGLRRWGRKVVAASTVARTDRVYGLYETGRMTEACFVHLVRNTPPSVASVEIYLHPSEERLGEPMGTNPGDLATLLSPLVSEATEAAGAIRTTYRELARQKGAGG